MPREVDVKIKVNIGQAMQNIKTVEAASAGLKKAFGEALNIGNSQKTEQALSRLGTSIGKVTASQMDSISSMRKWVQTQDMLNGGVVKAAGAISNAAGNFQKYKVSVDAGGNTTRNFTLSVNKATGEVYQLDNGVRSVSNSLDTMINKSKAFIAQTIGFNGLAQSMRYAFAEMKKMSDEMVTYQKVTGATGSQMAQVRASSYSSAKRYGQNPSDFLSSVSEFARAGYEQQSAKMADLATKTQLVGDMTAEMASSFLIATDAGYKLQGNMEKLSGILDSANEIDNKYATSIAKIAEGMTLTASLANQMNVPIEQLMAGLGTMTAVTQRSGSEMGRALRSVMLTVMKDTTTEVEEGVTVTTDQIKSLNDALNKYASDAVKAANATGKLLNPMDALGSLAKAYQDGLLNDQSLTGILSGIGGQRYSNALIALVQNWDEVYTRMLGDIATAAGSADAEVTAMTNGWTAKLNRFKTTWVEVTNNTVSEDFIKGWIDLGTGVLEYAGNLENLTLIAGGAAAAMKTLNKVMKAGSFGAVAGSGWGLGIGLGVTAVGMIKAAYDNYYAEMQESAERAAEKAVNAANTVKETTMDAVGALQKLNELDADGNGLVDTDKLEQVKTLNEEIVSLIGQQAEAYVKVGANISEVTDKIIQQTIAQNNAALDEIRVAEATGMNNFMQQGMNNRLFYEKGTLQFNRALGFSTSKDKAFLDAFEAYIGDTEFFSANRGYDVTSPSRTMFTISFEKPEDAEQMTAFLQEMKEIRLWLVNEGYATAYESVFSQLDAQIAEVETRLAPITSTRGAKNIHTASNWMLEHFNTDTVFGSVDEYKAYVDTLIEQENVESDLAAAIRETADAYTSLFVAEKKQEEAAKTETDRFGDLASSIEEATTAKEAFDKAMSTTMADGLKGYQEAFETLKKEIDEGRVNSTAAHAAYRMLLGDKAYESAHGSAYILQGMYEQAAESYKTLFGTYKNEHGDIVQGGGLLKLAEEAGLNVRDARGNYSYDFTQRDLERLSEYSKLSEEIIASAVSALEQYDRTGINKGLLPQDSETPEETATKENTTATTENTKAIETLSKYIVDIYTPVVEPGDSGTGNGLSGRNGTVFKLPDKVALHKFYANLYKDIDPVVLKAELDLSPAERQLRYFTGKKFAIYGSAFIGSGTPGATQNGTVGGSLKEMAPTVRGYADGTEGHPGGPALVNDGTGSNAGGELIVQNGRAFIAGGGAPTLVNLDRGARVFSARDTRKILGGGIRSYAAGNGLLNLDSRPNYVLDAGGDKVYVADLNTGFSKLYPTTPNDDTDTVYKAFADLASLMEYILARLQTALNEQMEAIDGQIEALRDAKDAADSQKELEERQEAVAEAQKDLQDAMNERTVRVLNDDGTWSWQADARKVQQAQEALDDANEALKEYREDLEFEAKVNALEAEKERLQNEYESIANRWSEIKDGVNTPTGDMDAILASILKGGSATDKAGANAVKDLLIGKLLTGGSFSKNYAEALSAIAAAGSGNPVMPGETGLNLAALIASGGSGMTDDMISSALAGRSGIMPGYGMNSAYSVTTNGNNYYFNGVKIGSDMLDKPLSETIRRLTVYDNTGA